MSTSAEKFAEWAQHRVSPPPPPPPEPKRDPVAQAFADAISANQPRTINDDFLEQITDKLGDQK